MYTPLNVDVFCEAFAGAFTAITNGERRITSPHEADYGATADVAFAIAQEFDTVWDGASADFYELNAILLGCYGQWFERPTTSVNPLSYAVDCNAVMAMVLEGEAVINAGGIIPPPSPSGSGSSLVRTKYADLDTTVAAADATGFIGLPYESLTAAFTAIGPNASAADANQLMVIQVSPGTAHGTEDPAAIPFRNQEIRSDSAPTVETGNFTWHNSVAAGGVHPGSLSSLAWHNYGVTGSLTCTDDGSVPSLVLISGDETPGQGTIDAGTCYGGYTPCSSMDISGMTACQFVLVFGAYVPSITSTSNATGAAIGLGKTAIVGNIVANSIFGEDATFVGTAYTLAATGAAVFSKSLFSIGTSPVISGGATATVTMDWATYRSFIEAGGTIAADGTTLVVSPTQGVLMAPVDVVNGAATVMGHGTQNNFACDLSGAAQTTFTLDPAPSDGQLARFKSRGASVTPALITAAGGYSIEQQGNPGNYSAANGDTAFQGQGAAITLEANKADNTWRIVASF